MFGLAFVVCTGRCATGTMAFDLPGPQIEVRVTRPERPSDRAGPKPAGRRPHLGSLIGKTIDPGPSGEAIRLGGDDQLPQDGKLSFILKAEVPAIFPRDQQIEVETEDGSFKAVLSLNEGTLVLEDSQSVIAEFDPHSSAVRRSARYDSAPFKAN